MVSATNSQAAGSGRYLRSISGTKTGSDHSVIDA